MFSNRIPWIILLLVWMAGSTWWHVCKIKLLCADSPAPGILATGLPLTIPSLIIADGTQFRYNAPGNYSFARSKEVANDREVGPIIDSLTRYLAANPGKTLIIGGYYSPTEQNTTAFANLGIARADGIKQVLKQRGIPDSALITTGVSTNSLVFSAKGDSLYGGLAFNFGATAVAKPIAAPITTPIIKLTEPVTENELAEKEKFTSVFQPIDLYFQLGEATYIKTSETTKFFDEATRYLADNKGKKLLLTGYTDNSGPDPVNMRLSRDRANSVKARLRKLGIDVAQIQVDAKGEADPKADNSTLSGRKANRRVTVVVQ